MNRRLQKGVFALSVCAALRGTYQASSTRSPLDWLGSARYLRPRMEPALSADGSVTNETLCHRRDSMNQSTDFQHSRSGWDFARIAGTALLIAALVGLPISAAFAAGTPPSLSVSDSSSYVVGGVA